MLFELNYQLETTNSQEKFIFLYIDHCIKASISWNILNSYYFIAFGIGTTINSISGNYVGEGNVKKSMYFTKVVLLTLVIVIILLQFLKGNTMSFYIDVMTND